MKNTFYKEMEKLMLDKTGYVYDFQLLDFSKELIEHKDVIPLLYRYSSIDSGIIGIKDGTIYLSQIGEMDDLFEGLTTNTYYELHLDIENLNNGAYIKSFSESKCNMHMWAEYGNRFKGICVEYDIRLLQSNDVLYHLYPVIYSSVRMMKGSVLSLEQALIKAKKKGTTEGIAELKDVLCLYLAKSKDWEAQKEWRLAVSYEQMNTDRSSEDAEMDALYNISQQCVSFDCISKVFLGPRMSLDKKREVYKAVEEANDMRYREKRPEIKLYVATIHESEYTLDYNEDIPVLQEDDLF